jgi:hypothetical protein
MKTILAMLSITISYNLWSQQTIHFQGEAFNDKNEMVYREYHQLKMDEKGLAAQVTTYYTKPDSKEPFAQLVSIFDQNNSSLPRTLFIDERFGTREEVTFDNDGKTLIITQTEIKRDRTKESRLSVTSEMVHGQGYHNFILNNFDNFKAGNTRQVDFVVPSRMSSYKFELTALGVVNKEPELVGFQLDIKNWFLRMFADKIVVQYDAKSRKLMSYHGLTNIQDDKGQSQSLKVHFNYDLNEPLKVSQVK